MRLFDILKIALQILQFEVASLSHYRYISGGIKFKKGARDSDHAPFWMIYHIQAGNNYDRPISKI